jgi:excisionase family DNA binding protein
VTAPLLDARAAGALLGVPHTWVLAEARADRIPHVRLGRYVRFDGEALEAWWRNRLRGPVANGYVRRTDNQRGPAALQTPRPRPTRRNPS